MFCKRKNAYIKDEKRGGDEKEGVWLFFPFPISRSVV